MSIKPAPIICIPNVPETKVTHWTQGICVQRGALYSAGAWTVYREQFVKVVDWT